MHLEKLSLNFSSLSFLTGQVLIFSIIGQFCSPLWFIIIPLVFFYLENYYFQVSFTSDVVLWVTKITQNSIWSPLTKWFQNYLLLNQLRSLSHAKLWNDKDNLRKRFLLQVYFTLRYFVWKHTGSNFIILLFVCLQYDSKMYPLQDRYHWSCFIW